MKKEACRDLASLALKNGWTAGRSPWVGKRESGATFFLEEFQSGETNRFRINFFPCKPINSAREPKGPHPYGQRKNPSLLETSQRHASVGSWPAKANSIFRVLRLSKTGVVVMQGKGSPATHGVEGEARPEIQSRQRRDSRSPRFRPRTRSGLRRNDEAGDFCNRPSFHELFNQNNDHDGGN